MSSPGDKEDMTVVLAELLGDTTPDKSAEAAAPANADVVKPKSRQLGGVGRHGTPSAPTS